MKLSVPKFGLVIYRCTYSDDAAWTQLLSLIQREAQEQIKELGPGRDWLGAHLEWMVVEDQTLDGASQEQVKRRFDEWADGVVDDYERTSISNVRGLPRFNFCVFVDKRCLESLEEPKAVVDGRKLPVFVILMRAERGIPDWVLEAQAVASQYTQSGIDSGDKEEYVVDDEEEEVEDGGDDSPLATHQATWMYVETRCLLSLYNSLHTDSSWEHFYVRPPGVYGRNEA